MGGKVWLVGAGPGDPGLLTVKAAKLLQQADVVVYDRLVSENILSQIPAGTKRIDVGKNVGHHPVPQSEINRILLREAQEGSLVVRLKGGDPFVFGRGGEELELLQEQGVPFEVVPGITSSIAAPAYAGIPVTHRDFCSSVHIITGHAKVGETLRLDFDALVRLNGTLVFMMSVGHAEDLADGLLSAGMPETMPAAIVENGTRPNQRRFITTVGALKETIDENRVQSPAVLLVGKVCALGNTFGWYDELPLKGLRILVTRPQKKASLLAEKLEALGAMVTCHPCIETIPLDWNCDWKDTTALIFTSAAGVECFGERMLQDGDARMLAGKKLLCVGSQTAQALKQYGLCADFVPSVFDGAHLAKEAVEQGVLTVQDRVRILRAREGSEELTQALNRAAIPFEDIPAYETRVLPLPALQPDQFDWVTFTSKSCVDGLAAACAQSDFSGMRAVCIGAQTAKAAAAKGFTVYQSAEATIDSMVALLQEETI